MAELNTWQLEDHGRGRRDLRPLLKWAVAAALFVAVGFAAGRLGFRGSGNASLDNPRSVSLSSSLESSIRSSVRRELSASLEAELAGLRADLRDDFRREIEGNSKRLATAAVLASRNETLRLMAALAERYELAREQDRRTFAEALGQLRARSVSELATLENRLGALAWLTEEELLRMEQGVGQLLARQMTATRSKVENVSHTPDNH
jgi:hypothetical protein